MSTEENKAIIRRVIEECVNKGNLDIADEVLASNYIYHFPTHDIEGPEGFKEFIRTMRTAFPDLHVTIEDFIAEGDKVVGLFTMRGTFKGELMGIQPTGRQLTFQEAVVVRFEGGKEVEATAYANMISFNEQLGIS
ncbi:ester cyclase [Thermodesulfobacteriota bacterium]